MANGVRQTTSSGVVHTSSGVAQTVVSSGPTIVDSFEDQDKAEYDVGDASAWNVDQTFASDGSYGLTHTGAAQSKDLISTSGLDAYPSQGSEFHIDHEWTYGGASANSHQMRYYFAYNDGSNHYMIQEIHNDGNLEIWRDIGSGYERIASSFDANYPENTKIRTEVVWDDGTLGGSQGDITVTLIDTSDGSQIDTLSANDTNHTSGGMGFNSNIADSNFRNSFDYWRIV